MKIILCTLITFLVISSAPGQLVTSGNEIVSIDIFKLGDPISKYAADLKNASTGSPDSLKYYQ